MSLIELLFNNYRLSECIRGDIYIRGWLSDRNVPWMHINLNFSLTSSRKKYLMRSLSLSLSAQMKIDCNERKFNLFKPWREKCWRARRWWKYFSIFVCLEDSTANNGWMKCSEKNIFCMHHKLQNRKRKTENHAVKMEKRNFSLTFFFVSSRNIFALEKPISIFTAANLRFRIPSHESLSQN